MKWRVDHMNPLSNKDRIECLSELRIVVVDQKVNARRASFKVPDNLACLVGPGRVWILGTACKVDAPAAQLDEEKYI